MKLTQAQKILKVLSEHNGQWVNGRYFLQSMMISQYHARIKELQEQGIDIEASDFKDEYGFKSYRIKQAKPKTQEQTQKINAKPLFEFESIFKN